MKKAKSQSEAEPSELSSVVGERIRKIRRQKGLSLESFALRCNMNSAYIGHIERGIQNPTLNTLERICKGLDIGIEELFKDNNSPIDMNSSYVHYWIQLTSNLSPDQLHQLLNIIRDIVKFGK